MPLFHGKSKSDFGHNVKEEMHEGKPLRQSLAIAYSMKHRSKKAHGGMCAHGADMTCPKCTYPKDSASENDPTEMERMAKGGTLGESPWNKEHEGQMKGQSFQGAMVRAANSSDRKGEHRTASGQRAHALREAVTTYSDMKKDKGDRRNLAEGGMVGAQDEWDEADYNKKRPMHPDEMAMHEDDRKLGQHGEIEEGPQGPWMADGGQITGNYSDEEDGDGTDMVGRIMAQRQRMFSKGGKVSNQDELEADFSPNEFDDLHLRDNLEQHDTGANSGDELGDAQEDEDRHDIVSRIMRSRRKGPGHNPRPA